MATGKQSVTFDTNRPPQPKLIKMGEAEYKAKTKEIMQSLFRMSHEQQATLAGRILEWCEVGRETFEAFWSQLSEPSQEELGAWMMLMLDGDEEEAAQEEEQS